MELQKDAAGAPVHSIVLLPCPFCGVDPVGCPHHNEHSGSWEIACCNCGGLMLAATEYSVVEQWQDRKPVNAWNDAARHAIVELLDAHRALDRRRLEKALKGLMIVAGQ